MIDVLESIHAPTTNSPNLDTNYFVDDLSNYMFTDEFLIEISDKMEIPSKARISINELKVKRMAGQKRKELESYINLQKLVAKIKESLEEFRKGTIGYAESSDTAIPSAQVFPQGIGRVGEIHNRLESYSMLGERKEVHEVIDIEKSLSIISESIARKKLISFSELEILKRAMESSEEDNRELRLVFKLLGKEITNRTKKTHKDLFSYLRKIEKFVDKDGFDKIKSGKLEERIRRNMKAIILDELDNGSNSLIDKYLTGKLEYKEYLKRKQELFSDYNRLWPD